jgi:hypothetical protein
MAEEKGVAYVLGIVSLVLAFFQPLPAIIIGIVGLVQNKKDKSKIAKKLNILGIVVGAIVLVVTVGISIYLMMQGAGTFPVY